MQFCVLLDVLVLVVGVGQRVLVLPLLDVLHDLLPAHIKISLPSSIPQTFRPVHGLSNKILLNSKSGLLLFPPSVYITAESWIRVIS